jgi:aldehyde dehydrogenase
MGHPLNKTTMMGTGVSLISRKILSYIKLGGKVPSYGGDVKKLGGDLDGGYYIQPL